MFLWLILGALILGIVYYKGFFTGSYLTPASSEGWYQPYYKSEPKISTYVTDPADRYDPKFDEVIDDSMSASKIFNPKK